MNARKLGKFEILERLGRGGMAEVYRAHQPSLDRYVAIKVLHSFLADDPEFTARFEREARNIGRLRHPNIVQVHDFEIDAATETYYMVMELIDGPTLKDVLEQLNSHGKLMSVRDALRVAREATAALAYAHSQSMVHRDVKPANLMLDGGHRVVLTDFGIARIVSGAHLSSGTAMVGTPAYMAPEQGLGDTGDERSDLYSLGVILYQMLSGRLPYDGETPLSVVLKHLNEPIPSARALNPDVPEVVDDLIQRLMAKDPAERYQTASELITEFDRIEANLPPEPPSDDDAGIRIGVDRTYPMLPQIALERAADMGGSTLSFQKGSIARPARPVDLFTQPGKSARRRGRGCLWLAAALLIIGGAFALLVSWDRLPLAGLFAPSPTPTLTETPAATPTAREAPTATLTPAPTLTTIPTEMLMPDATFTASPTPAPTETPTITPTPTIDVTQTMAQATLIMQLQTATIQACDFDYQIIEQTPRDGDYFLAGREYRRQIRLLNTGTCPWERNTALVFVRGESFNANPPYFFIRERVNVGEETAIEFVGRTPATYGYRTGEWELRTPGQLLIGSGPISISINVYEGGS